jgi:hypothetical protein
VDLLPGVRLIPAPTNETDRMLSNDLDPDTVLVAGSVTRPERVIIVNGSVVPRGSAQRVVSPAQRD